MGLSTKDIEGITVSSFKLICSRTDGLSPNVSDNDKTPSYDGDVYVYRYGREEKNENIIGIVKVQLKGTCKELKNNKIQVKIDDLKIYSKNNSCLYIVGFIDVKNDYKVKFFYRELNRFNIEKMLKDKKGKKLTVKLQEFPKNNKDIYDVFLTAYNNEQNINLHKDIKSIKDVLNNSLEFKGIKIPSYGKSEFDFLRNISKGNILLQAVGKSKFSTPITADFIELIGGKKLRVTTTRDIQVKLGEEILYEKTKVGFENGKFKIDLSEQFYLLFNEDDKLTFNIKWNTLAETIVNLKFLLNIFKVENKVSWKHIEWDQFNEIEKLDQAVINKGNKEYVDHIKSIEELIQFFSKVQEKLKEFNILKDLDISNLSENDKLNLDLFMGKNIQKLNLKNLENACYVTKIKISNINISIFILVKDNEYKIFDFFNEIKGLVHKYEDKVTSIFTFLDEEQLEADNFKADFFIKDLKDKSDGNIDRYTQLLLNLIKVYDNNISNEEIRIAMFKLAEFLYKKDEEDCVYCLNYLQVKYRICQLNEDDIKKINSIKETSDNIQIKIGCEILKHNKKEVEKLLNSLNEDKKNEFKTMPIYSLFEKEILK